MSSAVTAAAVGEEADEACIKLPVWPKPLQEALLDQTSLAPANTACTEQTQASGARAPALSATKTAASLVPTEHENLYQFGGPNRCPRHAEWRRTHPLRQPARTRGNRGLLLLRRQVTATAFRDFHQPTMPRKVSLPSTVPITRRIDEPTGGALGPCLPNSGRRPPSYGSWALVRTVVGDESL